MLTSRNFQISRSNRRSIHRAAMAQLNQPIGHSLIITIADLG
ncbi:hypothetical protein SynA1562_01375 [Synechococcus sp. A15-62]|nr:hypothetical protein SynA1562_01375 [Synechococcus sp. A15-62]